MKKEKVSCCAPASGKHYYVETLARHGAIMALPLRRMRVGVGLWCRSQSWQGLEDVLHSGGCRAIGLANFTAAHVDQILRVATVKPHFHQFEYHPLFVSVSGLCVSVEPNPDARNGLWQYYSCLSTVELYIEHVVKPFVDACSLVVPIDCNLQRNDSVADQCRAHGMQGMALSPLCGGRALGAEHVAFCCKELEKSPAQVTIRWLLQVLRH